MDLYISLEKMPRSDREAQAGDVKMTAGEAGKLLYMSDFPFTDAEPAAGTS